MDEFFGHSKRRGCYGTDDWSDDAAKTTLRTAHEGVLRRLEMQRQVDETSAVQCSYSSKSASAKGNHKAGEIQGQTR